MNGFEILGITLLVIMAVLVIIYFLIPYLNGKGIPIGTILKSVNKGINIADDAVTTVNSVAPIPYFFIVDKIFNFARTATQKAEDLYKSGCLGKDERKEVAKQSVIYALKAVNITVDENLEKVIEDSITGAVKLLPKTHQTK